MLGKLIKNEFKNKMLIRLSLLLIFISGGSYWLYGLPVIIVTLNEYRNLILEKSSHLIKMLAIEPEKIYYSKLLSILIYVIVLPLVGFLGRMTRVIMGALIDLSNPLKALGSLFDSQAFMEFTIDYTGLLASLGLFLLILTLEGYLSGRLGRKKEESFFLKYISWRLNLILGLVLYFKVSQLIGRLAARKPLIYLMDGMQRLDISRIRPQLLDSLSRGIVVAVSGYKYVNLSGVLISRSLGLLAFILVFVLIKLSQEVGR